MVYLGAEEPGLRFLHAAVRGRRARSLRALTALALALAAVRVPEGEARESRPTPGCRGCRGSTSAARRSQWAPGSTRSSPRSAPPPARSRRG